MKKRTDVNPKRGVAEYGDVTFGDPTNKKYPLDTAEHIKAAWSYIHHSKNAAKYSAGDAKSIKARIVAAWKKQIDKAGPPALQESDADTLCEACNRHECECMAPKLEALRMLRARCAEATTDPTQLPDVAFGLKAWREAAQAAGAEEQDLTTVEDLRNQVTEITATSDPIKIAAVLGAVGAFLDSEIAEQEIEADEADENDDASNADPAATERQILMKCEHCGGANTFTLPRAAGGVGGHMPEVTKEAAKKESEPSPELVEAQATIARQAAELQQLREAAKPAETPKLVEAEREELTALRAAERFRTQREAAQKLITERGADGIITVDDLVGTEPGKPAFVESQWPGIINLGLTHAGRHPVFNTEVAQGGPAGGRTVAGNGQSARQFFESEWGGAPASTDE
jgi:hypothetical protein